MYGLAFNIQLQRTRTRFKMHETAVAFQIEYRYKADYLKTEDTHCG